MGANDQGRVGFNRGRGEGSRPEPARAGGGGGGGQNDPRPPQLGQPPDPGVIPDRIPVTPPPPTVQRLPPSGPDYDAALRPPTSNLPFGVPNGGTEQSAGPGTGEGIGTGRGTGVGSGDGRGVGPGNDRNMGGGPARDGGGGSGGSSGGNPNPNEPVPTRMLTRRVNIISKPEPLYTEEARRNQVNGRVVLRALFNSSGQVTNITPVQRLPNGLTEQAIAAARRITFTPAQREGRAVSTYVTLQYDFNMY